MELSDQELLGQIASRDTAAFATFYDRHAPRLLGLLCKWLHRREDAEDLLQETFWRVWCGAVRYDPQRSPPGAWLVLIARSRALDHLRCRRPEVPAQGPGPEVWNDPVQEVERGETAHELRAALTRLPGEQQRAIVLAFFNGLTYEQVAQREAIPSGTAKTRIRLGMRRLAKLLRGKPSEVA